MTRSGSPGRFLVLGLAGAGLLMVLAAAAIALWPSGVGPGQGANTQSEGLDGTGHVDGDCGAPLAGLRLSGFFSSQQDDDPPEEVAMRLVGEGEDGAQHVFCGTLDITVERIRYGAQEHNYTAVHAAQRNVTEQDFVDPYASREHDWYLPLLLDDDVFPEDAHYRVRIQLTHAGGVLDIAETIIYDSDA